MYIKVERGMPRSPIHIIWGILALGVIAISGFLKGYVDTLPACAFRQITGIPCLTCGGTRSIVALSEISIAQAFTLNPLTMLFLSALILFSLLVGSGLILGRSLRVKLTPFETKAVRYLIVAAVAVNWAYLIISHR